MDKMRGKCDTSGAWLAKDLESDRSWVYILKNADRVHLAKNIKKVYDPERPLFDYSKDDFEKKVLEITKNNGVDVIYDSVGKDTFLKGIGCLAPKGRIVSFGVSSGPIDPININMLRSFSGSISTGGLNTYIKDANEMQMNAETFFDMIIKKDLEINIDKTFHIDKIREAQSILEKRQTTGSIVLKF